MRRAVARRHCAKRRGIAIAKKDPFLLRELQVENFVEQSRRAQVVQRRHVFTCIVCLDFANVGVKEEGRRPAETKWRFLSHNNAQAMCLGCWSAAQQPRESEPHGRIGGVFEIRRQISAL
jgi:hypothetical protein